MKRKLGLHDSRKIPADAATSAGAEKGNRPDNIRNIIIAQKAKKVNYERERT